MIRGVVIVDRERGGDEVIRRGVAQFPPPGRTNNPYGDLLYAALAERGFPRVYLPGPTFTSLWRFRRTVRFLHFHWRPDKYYAPCLAKRTTVGPRRLRAGIQLCRFTLWLACARVLGYQIVWTVHDVRARRWAGIDRAGRALLARASSALLAHNDAIADRLRAELGREPRIDVVPHGSFQGVYPPGRSAGEVRAALGISPEAFVFLSFGQMRADKQVGVLLDAFASVALPEVYLVIAGVLSHRPSRRHLERAAHEDGRVRVISGDIPHERVAELFAMADAFVLARSDVWTSGSLVLALSLGLPAVAARLAPAVDLLGEGEAGWLFEPDDVESMAKALSWAASDPVSAAEKRTAARSRGAQLPSWDVVAQQTIRVLTRGPRGSGTWGSDGGRSRDQTITTRVPAPAEPAMWPPVDGTDQSRGRVPASGS